jgi:hypothetical protein
MSALCWYSAAEHRPRMSSCPAGCTGDTTHAERQGDGEQRFYCIEHALWRARDVGRQRVRTLRVGERP